MSEIPMSDVELRKRTEQLLAEAVLVANQLKVQTERLSRAIDLFHTDIRQSLTGEGGEEREARG